jgi:hypothetical protein
MSSSLVFSGVRVTRSLILCVCFVDRCLSFVLFFMAIVLSVFLRYTDSDYPFSVFKLFLPFLFWLLYFLFYFDIRIQITPLISSNPFISTKEEELKYQRTYLPE